MSPWVLGRRVGYVWTVSLAAVALATATFAAELEPMPPLELDGLEVVVATQLEALATGIDAGSTAADWGTLGAALHAYELIGPAEAAYRNALRLAPDDPRWPHLLGLTAELRGDLEAAIRRYRAALTLAPGAVGSSCRLGLALFAAGQLEQAEEVLRPVVELDPACAAAHAGLGEVALARGDHATAERALRRAIELEPAANRLRHPLGLALRGLGRLEEARVELAGAGAVGIACPDPVSEAVRGLAGGERVAMARGRMALNAGHAEAARGAFEAALATMPTSSAARIGLAAAHAAAGRREQAIAELVEVARTQPSSFEAWFNLGILLRESGRLDDSIRAWRRTMVLEPEDLDVRLELARTLVAAGRLEEGLLELGLAELAHPTEPRPAQLAAGWLAEHGQWARASIRLEAAIGRGAGTPELELSLARLLVLDPDSGRRDPQRAESLTRAVIGLLLDQVVRETLVLVLAAQGDCEGAALQLEALGRGDEAALVRQGDCLGSW